MKNLLFPVIILFTLQTSAQKIGGFYSGTLYNDSTRMVQNYELAIGEYKGKVTGYSYVTFVANDTFYYGIRKVKGYIKDDILVVEDDKFIANNFPESPAKKVKRTITVPLNGQDSVISLTGNWKTNKTKHYYSVPGTIELEKSNDSANSPLISHLRELEIIDDVVAEVNQGNEQLTVKAKISSKTKIDEGNEKKKVEVKEEKVAAPVKNPTTKQEDLPVIPAINRKTRQMQTIEISSDSLILAFYDNGVIDGDSISVLINGVIILPKTKLTASAVKKKVGIPSGSEATTIMLVAESLGTIPPNTGLLTITEGENIFQVNFSADMQTNATVVIKRK